MKSIRIILYSTIIALQVTAQVPTDNAMRGKVDSAVHTAALAYMQKPGKMALSVGVIYNGAFYKYNYGETAPATARLPASNTVYEIGSITKTFTALLLVHAISEKKISLNDDIRKYLKGDYPNLQYANGQKVKVAYLASHIARFPANTTKPWDGSFTENDFYNELHAVKLDTLQPYRYNYSNFGYQVLGNILENAYGLTYDQLIKKLITGPLNMPLTQVYQPGNPGLIRGYDANSKTMPEIPAIYPGPGSLRSDMDDMLNYANAQLMEKDPIIRQSHHLMYFSAGGANSVPWSIGRTRDWDYYQREDGGTFGSRSFMTLFPDYNIAIVLLSNETDNDAGGQLWDMTIAILNRLKL